MKWILRSVSGRVGLDLGFLNLSPGTPQPGFGPACFPISKCFFSLPGVYSSTQASYDIRIQN
jgi:hypothetical protein